MKKGFFLLFIAIFCTVVSYLGLKYESQASSKGSVLVDPHLKKILDGYGQFRKKYTGDDSMMKSLSENGQKPQVMVVACCDSRVDPALILQCDPGDLFVVRNVANIVPPYEKDSVHHGTSSALEFGIHCLKVKHLILLGHSQCGGIKALSSNEYPEHTDFIDNWVSLVKVDTSSSKLSVDEYAQKALQKSYENCLSFPWLKQKIDNKELEIHLWFFDIKDGKILTYSFDEQQYKPLSF